ncbi:MAG: hypothetical protein HQK75_13640 [Candidatus Magnetomorum sp.]|nr:hypothetical protein [Candidatus Magnetomorum sp.]
MCTTNNNFVMIDRITDIHPFSIAGSKKFNGEFVDLAVESCAQLGAFHVRYSIDCRRHVFLIKLNSCKVLSDKYFSGEYSIIGNLLAKSTDAYSYSIILKKNNLPCMEGQFIFALADYDEQFKADFLKGYYQKILSELLTHQTGHQPYITNVIH